MCLKKYFPAGGMILMKLGCLCCRKANIPEIGATEPEKTEKRGCNIPFYSRVNKNPYKTKMHCVEPDK